MLLHRWNTADSDPRLQRTVIGTWNTWFQSRKSPAGRLFDLPSPKDDQFNIRRTHHPPVRSNWGFPRSGDILHGIPVLLLYKVSTSSFLTFTAACLRVEHFQVPRRVKRLLAVCPTLILPVSFTKATIPVVSQKPGSLNVLIGWKEPRERAWVNQRDGTRGFTRHHDRDFVLSASQPQVPTVPLPLMSANIKYADLHSLPAYNTSSTSRLKYLYSDVSRQKHSNPISYQSTIHWWREVLQTVVLKHWLPQSSDTLVLHALPALADSFRYEGAGKPLCIATVIVSSMKDLFFRRNR